MGLLPFFFGLVFLPSIEKDIRPDAFLSADNPALLYKQKVKQEFGLGDPLVIALADKSDRGVFNPQSLGLLKWLSEEVAELPNIDATRVASLATQKNIIATPDGMLVEPFYRDPPQSEEAISELRQAAMDIPLYVGSIISENGEVALLVAEMNDEDLAAQTYANIVDLVARAEVPPGVTLHVAGEGAIIGYLGGYVDADARRLIPICGVVILCILVIAYRGVRPAIATFVIVAATLVITLGLMAAVGIPFYIITNALPVILIGISVADGLHIYMHYFDLQAKQADAAVDSLVVETLDAMWRPITLTSLTTAAGFLGLYLAAYMPPFRYFGLFAAIGVMVAWFYSLFFLPAVMVVTKSRVSPGYRKAIDVSGPDVFSRFLGFLGHFVISYPRTICGVFAVILVLGAYSSAQLIVDENPLKVFHRDEPVVVADQLINRYLNGTNTLDIVVETDAPEALLLPRNLRYIDELQNFLNAEEDVGGSTSIVDYLKQMNRALNEGLSTEYQLPETTEAAAQYLLIYSATADPTDFEEEIDYDYQTANIRAYLKSGDYQDVKRTIESLQKFIDAQDYEDGFRVVLSGRVYLHYRWISELARSHFQGLGITLMLVFLMSAALFRSLLAGVFTMIPVAGSVLFVYAAMSLSGLTLGLGTSMFAAVAVGLGIDFAIHTVERIRAIAASSQGDIHTVLLEFYGTTGRVLLFNFLAISSGFAILTVSKISSLNSFGAMVGLAVGSSFLLSVTVLPALVLIFRPSFIGRDVPVSGLGRAGFRTSLWTLALLMSLSWVLVAPPVWAEPEYTAAEVVENVNAAPEGQTVTRYLEMRTTDRRGKQRVRKTVSYRKSFEDQKRTILFFTEPATVMGTAFLIWDYEDPESVDDQWLYVPALRKVRRVSAADRGDYFLGTDFTYEDTKLDGKLEPRDYSFEIMGQEELDGQAVYRLKATPKTEKIAEELGYSRFECWIDPSNWMMLRAEFWDGKGQPLKTLTVGDIRKVDGIWTRHYMSILNRQTGHRTEYFVSNVDYSQSVDDAMFTTRAMKRGL